MILHVVFYQPKASATDEELAALVAAIERASREIPTIRQVRAGKAVDLGFSYSTRSLGQKLAYMAVFEFNDLDGLRAYLSHEEHSKLAQLFWSTCEETMIVDVEAVDPMLPGLPDLLGK
jgi:hypothetical protein